MEKLEREQAMQEITTDDQDSAVGLDLSWHGHQEGNVQDGFSVVDVKNVGRHIIH